MSEQTKRGPGRPRKYTGYERTTVYISIKTKEEIDERRGTESLSQYIERVLRKELERK